MFVSANKCATAGALAALAVAMYGCSSDSYDLSFSGGGGAGLETSAVDDALEMSEAEQEVAQGSIEEQTLSEAEAVREEAERLVQAAEDAEDIAGAAVERLTAEVADAVKRGVEEEAETVRQELEQALAALEAARGALQAALIVLEVAEAQVAAARTALAALEVAIKQAEQDALDAVARDAGVAWAIERAANEDLWDYQLGYTVGSWSYHWDYPLAGSSYASISRSHRAGGRAGAVFARDDGELDFNVTVSRFEDGNEPVQDDPEVWPVRYFNTYDEINEQDDVSIEPKTDHGLGAGWQQFKLTQEYGSRGTPRYFEGSTLTVSVFTDLNESDSLPSPYGGNTFDRTILLDDVGALPVDQDFFYVYVPESGLAGSLDGVDGRFTCAQGSGCALGHDTNVGTGFHPPWGNILFTPDDGTEAIDLAGESADSWPYADYLSMGHWLFVPVDATDFDAYDFGVFAGGSDPYDANHLITVSDTAHYFGVAAGIYHARLSAGSGNTGDFDAKVVLTAEFGTNTELGTIGGRLYDFDLDSSAPFTAPSDLTLDPGNISQEWFSGEGNVAGGWVWGNVPYQTDQEGQGWWGSWNAKFFGNGIVTTDEPPSFASQPSSVAGTFSAKTGNNVGLVGAFGAYLDEPAEVLPVDTGNN